MKAVFKNAWGYQGDAMNLPVADVESAVPFYERHFGFRVESRVLDPVPSATLTRDNIRFRLAENGGDPTQDGVAFEVDSIEALQAELKQSGLSTITDPKPESRPDNSQWQSFFATAPDGLCYWFGQRMS